MKKTVTSLTTSAFLLAAGPLFAADVGKAASEATDAARHKIDEKRADSRAKDSGAVGKATNGLKSKYHENRAEDAADDAKKALRK